MNSIPSDGNPEILPAESTEETPVLASVAERQEVFRVLVTLQDQGETVKMSRVRAAMQFNISHEHLADIEREGIAMNWPPL